MFPCLCLGLGKTEGERALVRVPDDSVNLTMPTVCSCYIQEVKPSKAAPSKAAPAKVAPAKVAAKVN